MIRTIKKSINQVPSWIYWTALFLIGLLIIIFNDAIGHHESFLIFSLCYFIFFIIAVTRWCILQIKSIIVLKRDKTKMEMLHLKSQVNPHFFFNTLNNLYGLVEKNPKEAQSLILKLSDLMRYSIYEGQNEWVSLEEEIAYLKNYIELHKNRYHKKVEISFDTKIEQAGFKVMPLLLIILVENAFKHGVEKLRNDAFVNIKLIANKDRILFSILNNFDQEEAESESSGIGITNLKRRLEIGYKNDFSLSILTEKNTFQAQLELHRV